VPQSVQDEPEPPRKWNWFALVSPVILIAALVVAIPVESTELLLLGCLVAVAVAYIGARQCRDREDRGAGFAMITLGLATAGVFIALLALLLRL
jgi:drug/metabolite transporter (DMT)-like permease